MKKIRKRAWFEENLKNNLLKFFHLYKFNLETIKFKINLNKNGLNLLKIEPVIFSINFRIQLDISIIIKKKKNFYIEIFNFFQIKNIHKYFYLYLNSKFIHLLNFKKRILFKTRLKIKSNHQVKIEKFNSFTSYHITISKIKDFLFNLKKNKQNFYNLFNYFFLKHISNILQIKNLYFYFNFEINPDYFQIASFYISNKKVFDFTTNKVLFSTIISFFVLKDILHLFSNKFSLVITKIKKIFYFSIFLFNLIFNSSFLKFIFRKIILSMNSFYFFYQNLQLLFNIFKYFKNLPIFFKIKFNNLLITDKDIFGLFNLKDFYKATIELFFCKKLLFLLYFFYEKISLNLNSKSFLKIKLLDKLCLTIFLISKIYNLTYLIALKNEFIFLADIPIFKYRYKCLCLNIFFIDKTFRLLNIPQKICFLNYKPSFLLNKIFYDFFEYIDEFVTHFIFNCIFSYIVKKKNKENFKKCKDFLNFKLFKLIENKIKIHPACYHLHDFIEKNKLNFSLFSIKIVKLCIKLIFLIYSLFLASDNFNRKNFIFHFLSPKNSFFLKLIQLIFYKFIYLFMINEKIFFFNLFLFIKKNILYLKYITYDNKKKADFKNNLNFKFFYCQFNIYNIKMFWENFYIFLLKEKNNSKFLQIKTNVNLVQIFHDHIKNFFYFLFTYLIKKSKLKFYLISTSYFFRLFILILLLNSNNYLPKFILNYIIFKIIKKTNNKNSNLTNIFFYKKKFNKRIFNIKIYKKKYLQFSKFTYYGKKLNIIENSNFLKLEQNVIYLIYKLTKFFLKLKHKKFYKSFKKSNKLNLNFEFFLVFFVKSKLYKLEKENIYHFIFDRKIHMNYEIFQKNEFNSRISLLKYKKVFFYNFFGSYDTKLYSLL
jgi:hypothetical protein